MVEPIKWMKVAAIPPDVRVESALEPDPRPICGGYNPHAEWFPQYMGCPFDVGRRCTSSLPCKYKGLCAGAPKTEKEV